MELYSLLRISSYIKLILLLLTTLFAFNITAQTPQWEFLGLDNIGILDILIDDSSNIYVSGEPDIVYKSTDDGISWVTKNNGITVTNGGSLDLDSQGNIYFAAFGGVFKTTDGGGNWSRIAQELSDLEFYFIKVIPNDYIFVSNFNGIYRSTDYGTTWLITDYTYFGAGQIGFNANGVMFAGNGSASWASIYRSTNFGVNWTFSGAFPPSNFLFPINGDVFAAVSTNPFTFSDIYRSSNDGVSWDRTNSFVTSETIIYRDLELDRNEDFYVIINGAFNGVYISINSGVTWSYYGLADKNLFSLAIDSTGYIYAGTSSGIFRTAGRTIPVELSSFTIEYNGNNCELNWITGTETNNFGFEVERKYDDEDWLKIGFIQGNGTTTIEHIYTYSDKSLRPGDYLYRLKQVDYDGSFEYSKVIELSITSPREYFLSQNYPNPFNPTTQINYSIKDAGLVQIKVYDVLGSEVVTLVNESKEAGSYTIDFNATELPSGVYFYQLTAPGFTQARKMILAK